MKNRSGWTRVVNGGASVSTRTIIIFRTMIMFRRNWLPSTRRHNITIHATVVGSSLSAAAASTLTRQQRQSRRFSVCVLYCDAAAAVVVLWQRHVPNHSRDYPYATLVACTYAETYRVGRCTVLFCLYCTNPFDLIRSAEPVKL